MRTKIFVIDDMIAGLKNQLSDIEQKIAEQISTVNSDENAAIELNKITKGKIEAKIAALESLVGLKVTVKKYSAKQKDMLEQTLFTPSHNMRNVTQKIDIAAFKKLAIKFGVIDMVPRKLDMVKIKEAAGDDPEIWQIKDEVLDGELDWDFRDLLLEMIDEVNPKNWI